MPVNTTPITNLLGQIKSAEAARQNDVKISIQNARLLSIALAELLNQLNMDKDEIIKQIQEISSSSSFGDLTIEVDGGQFKS